MGYVMIMLTMQNILVSLVIIGSSPIRALWLRLKRCHKIRVFKKKYGIKSLRKKPKKPKI